MDDDAKHINAHAVLDLKRTILAAMSGQPNIVQWTALSDAVATILAATHSPHEQTKGPQTTFDLRRHLLEQHIEMVVKLIPRNEEWLRAAKEVKPH